MPPNIVPDNEDRTGITYYYSGINQPKLLEVLARKGASGMVNALYAGQPALLKAYTYYPEVGLALDYVEFNKPPSVAPSCVRKARNTIPYGLGSHVLSCLFHCFEKGKRCNTICW